MRFLGTYTFLKGLYVRVYDLDFEAKGALELRSSRLRVSGFGFRVSGFGFRVSGLGFRVSGLGFRVSGFGVRV